MPDDTTPPTVESIELSATSIDVDNGETTITVTAHFTDDISGIFNRMIGDGLGLVPYITFVGPSGQLVEAEFDTAHPIFGNWLDGSFQATLTFDAQAEAGTWQVSSVTLSDQAHNDITLFSDESPLLAAASFSLINAEYAPTISGTPSVTTNEDTPYTFAPTDFAFSDLDADDALQSVTITSLPTDGTLWFGSNPADAVLVTAGQTLDASDIAAGLLFFVPDTNENGDAYATFVYTVSDGIASSAPGTLTINVTAVNDAAILSSATETLTETDAPLSTSGTLLISEVDSPATFVAQTNTAGQYGTFSINAAGAWSYTASSAHDEFVAGTAYTDIFNVTSADGTATSVTINIIGSNDAPVITTEATQTVAENEMFVAALISTDADTAGPATFTITGGADQALFAISGGNLVFNAPRDYETQPHSYQVEVTANDGIDTTSKTITVNLADQIENAPVITINGTAKNDLIDATHTAPGQPLPTMEADTINGLGGNDTISGLGGADDLDGDAGTGDTASYATSAAGVAVSLATGTGSGGDAEGDTLTNIENLTGSNFDDTLEGNAGNNKLVGRLGIDTVSYADATSGANAQGVTVKLSVTKTQKTVTAGSDMLSGFENLTGSEFNDTLTGTTAANVLTGLGGNDILKGGAGGDWMLGGTGNDSYVVDNVGDVVSELDGEGTDTIKSSMSFSLAGLAFVENLTLAGKAALSGTGNALDNIIIGNSGANVLTGLGGSDTLNGGSGADQMCGGADNDTYVVDNAGDVANETDGDGIDTVLSSISFSLDDPVHAIGDIENLTLTGTGAIKATGNGLDNVLIGNGGNNILAGLGGADDLDGGAGTCDTASYAASTSGVTVSLMTGTGSGGDAEGDTLTNIESLTGSNFDDTLEGTAGNNKLVGGLGIDTVSYAHAASGANGVGVTVSLATTDSQKTVTAGSDKLSGFENLTGSQFNDTLRGNSGNNVLTGLGGNDQLTGAGGNDTFAFAENFGHDTITDFAAGPNSVPHDSIIFNQSVFSDFDAMMAATTQVSANTVITADADNSVTLLNVNMSNLHRDDFAFV